MHDVFGTVVDWRGAVTADGEALAARNGITGVDWQQFADEWRGLYAPSMNKVRTGELPWTNLDALHRMALERCSRNSASPASSRRGQGLVQPDLAPAEAVARFGAGPDPDQAEIHHRHAVERHRAAVDRMAKHCGLPWDTVLGSDLVRHYKPDAEMYRSAIEFLGNGDPGAVMMVAAHNNDLVAAAQHGMKTAYITRPYEHGTKQSRDFKAEHDFTYVANSFEDLATSSAHSNSAPFRA